MLAVCLSCDTSIYIGERCTRPMQIAAAIIPGRLNAPMNSNQHSVGQIKSLNNRDLRS